MAIFKSISSISNVKSSMKSSLIANSSTAGVGAGAVGSNDTSCFGGFDGGFDGGCGGFGGGRNINIIDIDLNQCARRRRRCCC